MAKFCCECGARLPVRSQRPSGALTPPQLPLPLVGRDDDLAWLEDRRLEIGQRVVGARVVGEPGSGKTRLLREFIARATNEGDFAVLVTPDPYYAEVGYYAVRQAVQKLASLSDEEIELRRFSQANAEAQRGLEEIFDGMPRRDDKRSPVERRYALAEGLRWALERAAALAAPNRVILAVDELHRIDPPSRIAFADALGEPPPSGALMVAAHVPGFEAGWSGEQASARVLPGLPPPAVQRLLRSARPSERRLGAEGDTGRGLLPMYVEQLLRYSIEGGTDPPSRLADLIALRVDTLEPDARRALQAVAVLGDVVEPAAIEQVLAAARSPESSGELEEALIALKTAGMIERTGELVSCSHPLLRDIALNGIPLAVRRDLHRKALRALEKRSAPIEACAQHAFYAQDAFQALLLLEQVADRGAARGDTSTEVLALRRGLELARQEISRGELDDPLRAVLIFSRKLGAALTRAGNFADAEGVLREALDVAGPSGLDRARVLGALAHVAHGRRRSSEAIGYIDEAIETARKSGAHDLVTAFSDTRRAWAS
jgi:serine/threonine-protein kinase